MADCLDVSKGAEIIYEDVPYLVTGRLDHDKILARTLDGHIPIVIEIKSLLSKNGTAPIDASCKANPLELVDEQKWETAASRRDAIKRVFEQGEDLHLVAEEIGVHPSTLYVLRKKYELHGFDKLIPTAPNGGAGKTRLPRKLASIIEGVIREEYLTSQSKSIAAVYREVRHRCNAEGTPVPGKNTVYRWCHAIEQQIRDRKRQGDKVAKDKYAQTMEGYQAATRPLEIVQIDHTLMDIIIVDDETREPIGRPWLTIAIDIYSRMVYGFYISLDPPSAMSTAICLQMAVFDKAAWLLKRDVDHHWCISGLLESLHMDNGKDFHSLTLIRGCEKYDIDMIYRPVGKPEYGAHVERLIGTFMEYMKVLPGATFSGIDEKGDYDSEANAVMTLQETEKWFATLITGRYHKEKHSSLGITPEERFFIGLHGSAHKPGAGINKLVANQDEFRMDFTPFFMVTVQNYGVRIEHIHYNCRELKRFLHTKDPETGNARKYLVRRDPRNLSAVFFFDPETESYIRVPYRKRTRPVNSLFELRLAQKRLAEFGKTGQATEDELFRAHEELRAIENKAKKDTKKARRNRQRRKFQRLTAGNEKPPVIPTVEDLEALEDNESCDDILPFDEVEVTFPQGDQQ